jgi:hypothetical protein
MAGTVGVTVPWTIEGTVLSNPVPLVWTGIVGDVEVPAWVAICSDPTGRGILFYGEPDGISRSTEQWDSFVLEAEEIIIAF